MDIRDAFLITSHSDRPWVKAQIKIPGVGTVSGLVDRDVLASGQWLVDVLISSPDDERIQQTRKVARTQVQVES